MARAWDGLGKEEPNHIHGGHYFYTLCTISRFCGHHADRETIYTYFTNLHILLYNLGNWDMKTKLNLLTVVLRIIFNPIL